MTLTIHDFDGAVALDDVQQLQGVLGTGVTSGCTPSLPSSTSPITIDVASGTVFVDNTEVSVGAQSVELPDGDSQHPRKDLVYVDSAGALQSIQGTPREPKDGTTTPGTDRHVYQPEPPDLSSLSSIADAAVVAEIWIPAGATSTADMTDSGVTYVRDRRLRPWASSVLTSGNIGTSDLSFDTATQSELDTHAGNTSAHHAKYTNEEAQDAVGSILGPSFAYDDATPRITQADEGQKTGPTRLKAYYATTTSFADGNTLTIGSESNAGYALSYHCSTAGTGYTASDIDWRFYWDGESTASFNAVAMGDSAGDPPDKRYGRHFDFQNADNGDQETWAYINFESPLPYDSATAELHNPTGQTYPEVHALVIVAEQLSMDPFGPDWRRHADGEEDVSLADGNSTTLTSVSNTRGRLYGIWMDVDDMGSVDFTVDVTLDGESTPSWSMNHAEILDIFGMEQTAGGGMLTMGEYDSGATQVSYAWTPGAMGFYSDFSSSMSVDVTNNSSATASIDWCVIWDEEV